MSKKPSRDGGSGGSSDNENVEETDPLLTASSEADMGVDAAAILDSEPEPPTLWTRERHAIPMFYFLLGFLTNLPRVALRDFAIQELRVSPGTQQLILGVIMTLPWNAKIFIGFLSDAFPIYGMHRKPYMIGGIVVCALSWVLLGKIALYTEEKNYNMLNGTHNFFNGSFSSDLPEDHKIERPNIGITCVLLFMSTFGMIFTDVCADTLVVERMKAEERGRHVGKMQTLCWQLRLFGQLVGLLVGGVTVTELKWFRGTVFFFNGIFPLMFLPSLVLLKDARHSTSRIENQASKSNSGRDSIRKKLLIVWDVMAEPYLWKPMIFVFINAAVPGSSDAFVNFMLLPTNQKGLGITLGEYTWLLAIGQVASILGAWLYQRYFTTVNWRCLFYTVMIASIPLAMTQFIVIFRWHEALGLNAFAFLFGSEVVTDVVSFLLQMPILIMSASLSPAHVEGTVYALQVSCNNIGLSVGGQLGAVLTEAFGITETDMTNLWKLTLVCIVVGIVPIFLVPCLPASAEKRMMGKKSPLARIMILCLLAGSLFITIISSIIEIAAWGGASDGNYSRNHILAQSIQRHGAVNGSAIYPTAGIGP